MDFFRKLSRSIHRMALSFSRLAGVSTIHKTQLARQRTAVGHCVSTSEDQVQFFRCGHSIIIRRSCNILGGQVGWKDGQVGGGISEVTSYQG